VTTAITTALITVIGAVLLAAATYWFTKARERDAEIRKEKLEHYRNFTTAMSGIITDEATDDGKRAFSLACNNLNLIASYDVLVALQEFQSEIRIGNVNRNRETHDILLSKLFFRIRQDLNIRPRDKETTFRVGLWAAGIPANEVSRAEGDT
jgi:hypothetical protein